MYVCFSGIILYCWSIMMLLSLESSNSCRICPRNITISFFKGGPALFCTLFISNSFIVQQMVCCWWLLSWKWFSICWRLMLSRIEWLAASFTTYAESWRASSSDLKVCGPIDPKPYAHSARTWAFVSFETPSMNISSPWAPKFFIHKMAHSRTSEDLSCKHW